MKALMSKTLREIISNPRGNKELQRGLSMLNDKIYHADESTEICVGTAKYKIQFVQRNLKDAEET